MKDEKGWKRFNRTDGMFSSFIVIYCVRLRGGFKAENMNSCCCWKGFGNKKKLMRFSKSIFFLRHCIRISFFFLRIRSWLVVDTDCWGRIFKNEIVADELEIYYWRLINNLGLNMDGMKIELMENEIFFVLGRWVELIGICWLNLKDSNLDSKLYFHKSFRIKTL